VQRARFGLRQQEMIAIEVRTGCIQPTTRLHPIGVHHRHDIQVDVFGQQRRIAGKVAHQNQQRVFAGDFIAVLLRVAGCRYAGRNAPAVKIHFTQEQLAAAANISRYPTGTILRELAAAGLVELGYGTITVMKPTLLRAMVEADS
jgi:hypothetical protein